MSYNVPFNFSPTPVSPTFNSDETKTDISQTGFPPNSNPYVPTCLDNINNVKDNYAGMVESYVQSYGMPISYWTTGYTVANHNPIYGEDPTAKYRGPRSMKAVIDLQSYSTFLTKYGIMSDLDIIIYIPIKAFQAVWGNVFPMSGDLFSIDNYACDRPLGQSPLVFEVTEKHDSINPTDFMAGHYVWKLTAKRYDNSYEPNAPQEKFLGGPVDIDGNEYGKVESSIDNTIIVDGDAIHDVDTDAKEDFNISPSDSIYGKYL